MNHKKLATRIVDALLCNVDSSQSEEKQKEVLSDMEKIGRKCQELNLLAAKGSITFKEARQTARIEFVEGVLDKLTENL